MFFKILFCFLDLLKKKKNWDRPILKDLQQNLKGILIHLNFTF